MDNPNFILSKSSFTIGANIYKKKCLKNDLKNA